MSVSISHGSGIIYTSVSGGLPLPAGGTSYIQNTDTLQQGATFYVSSGTVGQLIVISSLSIKGVVTSTTGFVAPSASFTYVSIGGLDIIRSSWTQHSMMGYTMTYTSGTLPANTSMTISAANLGGSAILGPLCTEIENINTAVVSVRLKDLTNLPTSFQVTNSDAINEKRFACWCAIRP